MENKKKNMWSIFGVSLACMLIAYVPYLQMHFSSDSYANLGTIGTSIHLRNGRIVTYAVQSVVNALGIHPVESQSVITFLFICVLAISVGLLYHEVEGCYEHDRFAKTLAFAGILLVYVNPFFAEWFLYVESLTSTIVELLFLTFSIIYASRGPNRKSIIISFLLLLLAMNMYQLYVEFFSLLALSIIFVKNEGRLNKTTLIHSVVVIAEAGVASILTILMQPLVGQLFGVHSTDRVATFEINTILRNVVLVTASQVRIWINGCNLLPKWSLLISFTILLGVFIIMYSRKPANNPGIAYGVLILIFGWGITFAPHFISSIVWIVPRTIPGVFHLFTFLLLAIAVRTEHSTQQKGTGTYIVLAITAVFLTLNVYALNGIISNNIANNRVDQAYARQIEAKIEEYERESGIQVTKIATVKDAVPTYAYPGIKYVAGDMNIRGLIVEWADVYLINYYCGRNYQKVGMPDDVYQTYFANRNWNTFDLDSQAVFIMDTLYLAMY